MAGEADRAAWNSTYEKGLVEILHNYKDNPKYKGQNESVATGNLKFTSSAPAPSAPTPAPTPNLPPPAPDLPPPAPVERSNSEQSLCDDLNLYGTNPFAFSFDGQARDENNAAQSASSNQDSSQTSKILEALEEKKRRKEEFSVEKCVDQVDVMVELTDEEKSYALDLFESETLRKTFIATKNPNVRLLWLKQKIRYKKGNKYK
uniref:Uncharacterized protein n=1 Tax=Setaria viridis TaxID=4556 RepID=A0A4U6VXE1_SETVI|nr:hypothetical protein SEVIR_2G286300v2 [Setaria viridis]